jgi:rhodanese-related sulfurtransferase
MANIPSITPQELMAQIKSGKVLRVDVRTVEEFTEDHIWGAQNFPIEKIPESLGPVPKDDQIVTVCNMGHGRSEEAARKLIDQGWINVRWLEKGHTGWVEAGLSDYEAGTASS